MVLVELGRKIQGALGSLTRKSDIDAEALDAMLKEIQRALLESDVNVMLVAKLCKNIKKSINLDEISSGSNKKRVIQSAVFKELCKLTNPETEPYKPLKGRTNVIMFVGLQVSNCIENKQGL